MKRAGWHLPLFNVGSPETKSGVSRRAYRFMECGMQFMANGKWKYIQIQNIQILQAPATGKRYRLYVPVPAYIVPPKKTTRPRPLTY